MAIESSAVVAKSLGTTSDALFVRDWENLVFREVPMLGKVLRQPEVVAHGVPQGTPAGTPESGKKFDAGKAPIAQAFLAYFPLAIQAVANVSKFGKEKYNVEYADKNWMRVEGAGGRYEDALARHSTDHVSGELYAADSRLLHAAHRAWNAMATLELLLRSGVKERQE